jgi:hypothetical protein
MQRVSVRRPDGGARVLDADRVTVHPRDQRVADDPSNGVGEGVGAVVAIARRGELAYLKHVSVLLQVLNELAGSE